MKTKADINSLIPTLVALLGSNNHEIGSSFMDQSEDGYGRISEPETNYLTYEADGWSIEIAYECCGEWEMDSEDYSGRELVRAWGEVTDISAFHRDRGTEEESEFENSDLDDLWTALDEELKQIA